MSVHYLVITPLRRDQDGRLVEVACWLDRRFTHVALDCRCGWRLRLLTPADLGREDLSGFYGEVDDATLERLTAELDGSVHAAAMVPAVQTLTDPTVLLASR